MGFMGRLDRSKQVICSIVDTGDEVTVKLGIDSSEKQ